jgi:hypothetical protein
MPSPFDIPTGPSPFAQEAQPPKKKPSYWLENSWVVCPVSVEDHATIRLWLAHTQCANRYHFKHPGAI